MHRFPILTLLAVLPIVGLAQTADPSLPDLAGHTLVVFNKADPDSQSLAETYAKARSIPADRVIGLDCALTEEITRAQFDTTIRKPLEDLFKSRGWMKRQDNFLNNPVLGLEGTVPVQQAKENPIWIMVLMRGMPLKIAEDPTILAPENLMSQLRANAAAVDSELALLPIQGLPLYGLVANPYFADKRIRPFSSFFANYLIMVTRLDGPSPGIVRRMIQDAVEVEKTELTGRAFFDLRSIEKKDDPYRLGDEWIDRAATLFRSAGFEVEIDRRWQPVWFGRGAGRPPWPRRRRSGPPRPRPWIWPRPEAGRDSHPKRKRRRGRPSQATSRPRETLPSAFHKGSGLP
ncbi:MAG: TIGR03790 family protein [Verrucomicrobiota bacterium]